MNKKKNVEINKHSKGGIERAKSLTPAKRKEIAEKGAEYRWTLPVATHGSEDKPLIIGDIKIPCYVLSDGSRVLVEHNMAAAIGFSGTGGNRITKFIRQNQIEKFVGNNLINSIENPIKFKLPRGGIANGYDANILIELCELVLRVRESEKLLNSQKKIGKQCEILIRGLARVGIIALIDEVTGFEKDKAAHSLAKILETFIIQEMQPWVSTFPIEFYDNLFRLRNLEFIKDSVKRPQYFGILTTDIVYKRLAPAVFIELKKLSKSNKKGISKPKLFQFLTNSGYNSLIKHIGSVIAVMKLSKNYKDFISKLNEHYPIKVLNNNDYPNYSIEDDKEDGI